MLLKLTHDLLTPLRPGNPLRKRISHRLIIAIRAHKYPGRIQHDISLIVIFTLHLNTHQQPHLREQTLRKMKTTHKDLHGLSDPRLNTIPSTTVYKRVLLQLSRSRQCLIRELSVNMVKERKRIRPRRLSNRRPNRRFLNISRRLIKAGQKTNRIIRSDGRNENLREQSLDCSIRRHSQVRRIMFRTFVCIDEPFPIPLIAACYI